MGESERAPVENWAFCCSYTSRVAAVPQVIVFCSQAGPLGQARGLDWCICKSAVSHCMDPLGGIMSSKKG